MDLKVRKVKEKPDEIKLILKLTEVIDRPKVDLQNPDKIIKVEVIGNKAGLALLGKDELLNVAAKS
jgi:tRNA(Ser,Leu) C12 N-acetylase TAN1